MYDTTINCRQFKRNIFNETSFGGLPVKGMDKTLEWPTCQTCKAEMQCLGNVKTDIGFEYKIATTIGY